NERLIFLDLEFELVRVLCALDTPVDDDGETYRVGVGDRIVRLGLVELAKFTHVEQNRIGKAFGCVGADFLLTQGRIRLDFQFHFAQTIEIASAQRDLDRLSPPGSKRKDAVQIRQLAGHDAILVVLAALVTEVADLKEKLAVFRDDEFNQGIEAVDILAPSQLFARGVQQSQRGIQRRAGAKGVDIKNEALVLPR